MIQISQLWGCGGRRSLRVRAGTILAGALLVTTLGGTAHAQCVGDCDGDGMVEINELIVGVNISLGTAELSSCPAFDANDSGAVEINELITAVNNALGGCPQGGTVTPTGTRSVTPTPTATSNVTPPVCATNTPVVAAGCGDGVIDLGGGEICDDGNTEEGDECPGNCRIAPCTPSQTKFTVRIDFDTTAPDVFITGLQLFVRYPESVISIPGSNSMQPVIDRVTSMETFTASPFDLDYGVNLLVEDSTFVGFESGEAATITFDVCEGASAPSACDLTCVVKAAFDANGTEPPVDEVPCTIVVL